MTETAASSGGGDEMEGGCDGEVVGDRSEKRIWFAFVVFGEHDPHSLDDEVNFILENN